MPRIAVIIVNYGTAGLVGEAVESMRRYPSGNDLAVHIVDNASPEADREQLRELKERFDWGADVRLHWNTSNPGFGQANNKVLAEFAASREKPDYVLFLNPDARVANDAVAILADFLDRNEKVAFAGPKIRLAGSGELRHAAFRFPGLVTTFLRAVGHPAIYRKFPNCRLGIESTGDPIRVDWVSGACCMARFETLEEIGFFEPAFFLYWEEVELMRRAARSGWECCHIPRAEILHQEGASTGVSSRENSPGRLPGHWYESWSIYFQKTHGRAFAFLVALLWLLGAATNILLVAAGLARRTTPKNFVPDFWRHGIRRLFSLPLRRPVD